eukprot:9787000-Alexandrium_andersonii.AAC.1
MRSSGPIDHQLGCQCTVEHKGAPLIRGRAAGAVVYPPQRCQAIFRRSEMQRRLEGRSAHPAGTAGRLRQAG